MNLLSGRPMYSTWVSAVCSMISKHLSSEGWVNILVLVITMWFILNIIMLHSPVLPIFWFRPHILMCMSFIYTQLFLTCYNNSLQVSSFLHGYDHRRGKEIGPLFVFWLFIWWWCQKIVECIPSITIWG